MTRSVTESEDGVYFDLIGLDNIHRSILWSFNILMHDRYTKKIKETRPTFLLKPFYFGRSSKRNVEEKLDLDVRLKLGGTRR